LPLLNPQYNTTFSPNTPSSDWVSVLHKNVQQNGHYQVRINLGGNRFIVSSIQTCDLVTSQFQDEIIIHVDQFGTSPVSLEYNTLAHCSRAFDVSSLTEDLKSLSQWKTHVIFEAVAEARGPKEDTVTPAEKEKQQQQQAEPGFFQKYWYIIVPLGLMVILNNTLGGGATEPQAEGQGGDANRANTATRRPRRQ